MLPILLRKQRNQMTTTKHEAQPCCGWDVRTDYIVVNNDLLKCPNCGKEYKRGDVPQPPPEPELPERELLPCPLCGSTDLKLRDIAGWELDCLGCELSLVLSEDPSREGLVCRWNTRAASPPPESIRQAAEEIISFMLDEYVDTDLTRERGLTEHIVAILQRRLGGVGVGKESHEN